eukprot:s3188_g8.t1
MKPIARPKDFAIDESGPSAGPTFAQVSHGSCLVVQGFELSEYAIEPWHSRCSADVVRSPAGVIAMPALIGTPDHNAAVKFQPGADKAGLGFEPRLFRKRSIQDGLKQAFEPTSGYTHKSFYCSTELDLMAIRNEFPGLVQRYRPVLKSPLSKINLYLLLAFKLY